MIVWVSMLERMDMKGLRHGNILEVTKTKKGRSMVIGRQR